eukprot:6938791-Ditylum_brightwellii.AAC.1
MANHSDKKSSKAVADMSEKKKLMKQAEKTLEGKTISYPCTFKKPDSIEISMLCLLQQQMHQQEEDKATREQQLLMAHM